MKTKKKSLFAILVAIVLSVCVTEQIVNGRESSCVQQLAWGHAWAAEHSKGVEYAANMAFVATYTYGASQALVGGVSCGVFTPASFVCYGGAALCGL